MTDLHPTRDMPTGLARQLDIEVHDSECTSYPYWIVVAPSGLRGRRKDPANIVACIHGVWLSRAAAQRHLDARRDQLGDDAIVWCASGHRSGDWRALSDALRRPAKLSEVTL